MNAKRHLYIVKEIKRFYGPGFLINHITQFSDRSDTFLIKIVDEFNFKTISFAEFRKQLRWNEINEFWTKYHLDC